MMDALNRKRIWYVLAVAGTAVAVKAFSSTSSVNDLLWILAPTAGLVELVTRSGFEFESYAGYMNRDKTFLIAASCSGINFLVTSFLMLAYGSLIRAPGRIPKWSWIPVTAAAAYLTTIIANTVRISTALRIQQVPAETGLISEAQAHRLEGIVVYFGFLVLLYYVSGLSQIGRRDGEQTSWSSIKSLLIPLAFYYS
ncbi:MAG: exosortase K, partial [Pyrinomonadaceae bacterium]|nr:exosortase K [Pyrinomonadaceae bacterium]